MPGTSQPLSAQPHPLARHPPISLQHDSAGLVEPNRIVGVPVEVTASLNWT